MYVTFPPDYDLVPGNTYMVRIRATNRIAGQSFQDDAS